MSTSNYVWFYGPPPVSGGGGGGGMVDLRARRSVEAAPRWRSATRLMRLAALRRRRRCGSAFAKTFGTSDGPRRSSVDCCLV